MKTKDDININLNEGKFQNRNKSSLFPKISGFLLIIAGILSIIFWFSIFSLDLTTIQQVIDVDQIKQINQNINLEQILGYLHLCALIEFIIAIFLFLGGILAIKKRLWSISMASSIVGLFSFGIIYSSSLLSLIAMIMLIISRKEFLQNL
jgi:hypothetical protein